MGQTHKESAPHSLYIGEEDVDQITIDTIFEKYAKKNQLGIWSGDFLEPSKWRKENRK